MKNSWKTILASDYQSLTDENHIFHVKDLESIAAIYGATVGAQIGPTLDYTQEHMIDGGPSKSLWSEKGLPFQYAIHVSPEGDIYWEMIEDYLVRRKALSGQRILAYDTGFINGRAHPFGPHAKGMSSAAMIPGYKLWIKLSIQTIPALVGEYDTL